VRPDGALFLGDYNGIAPAGDGFAAAFATASPFTEQGRSDIWVARLGSAASPSRTCLARRAPIGPRNIGRVRLGYTRRRLLRLPVKPVRRTPRSYRYCVKRSRGQVSAVFSRRGRVVLVATSARLHGNRAVRPGRRRRALRAYPGRVPLGRGLFRAHPRSRRLIGVRRGRVRFVAVADRRLLSNRRSLRRSLRLAGL
jgi:hypothetical protein